MARPHTQGMHQLHRRFLSTQRLPQFLLLLLLAFLVSACGQAIDPSGSPDQRLHLSPPETLELIALAEGDRVQVVASTSIIGDVVANVGGDHIDIAVLIPRGIDPHAYQPTPGDLRVLYQADLILLNGFDLETDLEDVLGPVSASVPVISLSEGLQARAFEEESRNDDHDAHGEGLDPHVWFDPALVSHWVNRTEQAFSRLDPAHKAVFQDNARRYRDELSALDDWIQGQVATIPVEARKLVLDHLVMGYFADRYGFEMISALVPAFSSAAEASARELADLSDIIRAEGVQAIFIGVDTNPRLAEQIAGDLDIEVVQLYTGSLGSPGGPAETYLEMMQYNVLAIKQVLGSK